MIVDPCYVLPDSGDVNGYGRLAGGWIGNQREISYEGLLAHYEGVGYDQPSVEPWGEAFGFVTGTLYGDGYYPIYAKKRDGRFAAVIIDFEPEDFDDD